MTFLFSKEVIEYHARVNNLMTKVREKNIEIDNPKFKAAVAEQQISEFFAIFHESPTDKVIKKVAQILLIPLLICLIYELATCIFYGL